MYSKDEVVALLNNRIKELELENGILKSERDESKDLLTTANNTIQTLQGEFLTASDRKMLRKQYSQDDYVDNLKRQISSLERRLKESEKNMFRYRDIVISKKLLSNAKNMQGVEQTT
jgi:homoserine kinase